MVRAIVEESSQQHAGVLLLKKSLLTKLFGIARSSLTYISLMTRRDTDAVEALKSTHAIHPWYGYRRLAWTLSWSYNKTRRIMQNCGIVARGKSRQSFIKPQDQKQPDMHQKGIRNHLKLFCTIVPHCVWRTDFTHIIFHGVHLYLATVLDEYTKKIVGYALSYNHTKEFVLEALKDAMKRTGKIPLYFHSDQGSEYTSFLMLQYLSDHHITPSMSRKGSPWENGAQESYYGKFKLELGSPKDYETMEMLILAIHRRVHYYNHDRLHTKLRDTPVGFERKYEARRQQFLSLPHTT